MIGNNTNKLGLNSKQPFVDIDLEKIYTGIQTEKAIQVIIDGKEGWFPKSKIVDLGNGKVRVPKWLLIKVKNQNVEDKSLNSGQPKQFETKKEEVIKESSEENLLMMKSLIESNQAMIQTLDKLVQDNNQFLDKLIKENEQNLNKIVQLINDLVLKLLNKNDGLSSEKKSVDENSEKIIKSIEKDLNPQMILPGGKKTTKNGDVI